MRQEDDPIPGRRPDRDEPILVGRVIRVTERERKRIRKHTCGFAK
jgi:hypothetical protein